MNLLEMESATDVDGLLANWFETVLRELRCMQIMCGFPIEGRPAKSPLWLGQRYGNTVIAEGEYHHSCFPSNWRQIANRTIDS